ncbi:MAG: DNA polymerase III subunit gamma/tau [Lachnospiraceae bacterium]|nr:DNA polymerase III subunit gamma/tau [Lachnospiraceae bacterium]
MYQALYRKFRPDSFDEVKGQDNIVTTLKNQIKNNRIGHAYLFTGTRGTGKTSVAKLFAKAVNCTDRKEDGSPCGECESCRAIKAGASMNVVEVDAASNNGVEYIREIREEVQYRPTDAAYRVYIIDEVHMLSVGAFNAILKTLEEPPEYIIFILATTEVHKIPITVLSRCQRYDFKRMTIDTMADRMRELSDIEGIKAEDRALRYIAKCANGSMRDALSLLDQCAAFHMNEELTYDKVLEVLGAVDTSVFSRLYDMILSENTTGAISVLEDTLMQGRDLSVFISDFIWYLRNLLLAGSRDENMEDVIDVSSETLAVMREESKKAGPDTLMRFIRIFSELSNEIRYAPEKRVLSEIAIIKLMRPETEEDMSSLKQRLSNLERKVAEGVQVVAVPGDEKKNSVKRPPVPDALPEDIKLVLNNWGKIFRGLPESHKALASMLQESEPTMEGDTLIIGFGNMFENVLRSEDNRQVFQETVEKIIGKHVNFRVVEKDNGDRFEETYPDLSQFINLEGLEVGELEDSEEGDN